MFYSVIRDTFYLLSRTIDESETSLEAWSQRSTTDMHAPAQRRARTAFLMIFHCVAAKRRQRMKSISLERERKDSKSC